MGRFPCCIGDRNRQQTLKLTTLTIIGQVWGDYIAQMTFNDHSRSLVIIALFNSLDMISCICFGGWVNENNRYVNKTRKIRLEKSLDIENCISRRREFETAGPQVIFTII